ncbi:FxSxx-COOH system tetratricopeptide repeat protein [Actinokineospora enzanensis]|uniref:FxSxx-COOH system tetratricopeptide repeat protein n=1 Tax=Actinokineospora enzanensis TaxID=155975 RepID=UPI00039CE5BB|nr:FxSxx-COOH system tetratricopeptide repeat protein [Actinokineospora enzanensis]
MAAGFGPPGADGGAVLVAFLAPTRGTGRTRLVANTACLLAAAGRAPLVVDLGSEPPPAHHYLRRFRTAAAVPVPEAVEDALQGAASRPTARDARPWTARMSRYRVPSAAGVVDVVGDEDFGPADTAVDLEHLAALGQAAAAAGYDHVLLDLPLAAGLDLAAVADLCDVAVLSFLTDGIGPADEIARALTAAPAPPALVLVPAGLGGPAGTGAEPLVRRAFSDLFDGAAPVQIVETPYRPEQGRFGALALLLDDSGHDNDLVRAYEQICTAMTGGAITEFPPLPRIVRERYLVALKLAEPTDTIWLAYAPADRLRADWIAEQLRTAGCVARRLTDVGVDPGDRTVIAVLTPALAGSPADAALRALPTHVRIVGVRSGEEHTHPAVTTAVTLPIQPPGAGTDARRALFEAAWVFDGDPAQDTTGLGAAAAFDSEPRAVDAGDRPRPSSRFVGRDDLLERVRDLLSPLTAAPDPAGRTVVLVGAPGVGKSEAVRAYCERFESAYDLIWWIPAGDRPAVRARLAALAATLHLTSAEPAEAVLTHLARRSAGAPDRWLLIYDDATEESVRDLLPARGAGDVIITAGAWPGPGGPTTPDTPPGDRPTTERTVGDRATGDRATGNRTPGDRAAVRTVLSMGPLAEDDAADLLGHPVAGVRDLGAEEARDIAAELGHLPVALTLAAAWLRAAWRGNQRSLAPAESVQRAAKDLRAGLAAPELRGRDPLERMVRLTITTLSGRHWLPGAHGEFGAHVGRLTVALARMCVFLAPDGISLRLVRSQGFLDELAAFAGPAGGPLAADEAEIERVLWAGVRFGLFEIDRDGAAVLRVHRVTQRALRAATEPEELARARAHVLYALARFAVTRVSDLDVLTPESTELARHLVPCEVAAVDLGHDVGLGDPTAPSSRAWAVRRWLVDQVTHLYLTHSLEIAAEALAFADPVAAAWTRAFGAHDPLLCRLNGVRADLCRELSRRFEALEIDQVLLAHHRRALGNTHPRTLSTARRFGGDLRSVGRYDEALAEDEATWRGYRTTFGHDHPETLKVAFNLGMSRWLVGRTQEALDLELASYPRRVRVLGEAHNFTLQSRRVLAGRLSELGRHREALRHLDGVLRTLSEHPDAQEALLARRFKLSVERRMGARRPEAIVAAGADLLRRVHRHFVADSGPVFVGRIAHSVDLFAADLAPEAVTLGEVALRAHTELPQFGDTHPFTAITRVNLAVFQHAVGLRDEAVHIGQLGHRQLCDGLDELHPWALAAAVNLAALRTGTTAEDGAAARAARDLALEFLGASHPTAAAAEHNVRQFDRPVGERCWSWVCVELG